MDLSSLQMLSRLIRFPLSYHTCAVLVTSTASAAAAAAQRRHQASAELPASFGIKLTALRPVGIGLRRRLRGSILMGYLVSKFQYMRESTLSVAVYAYYHFPVSSLLTQAPSIFTAQPFSSISSNFIFQFTAHWNFFKGT